MSTIPTSSEQPTAAQPVTSDTSSDRGRVGADGVPRKAWIGEKDGGDVCAIVWADTRNQARSRLAGELDLPYMEIQNLRRYPQLDGFSGDLLEWQLANGWHFECHQCYKFAYGREEGEEDAEGDFAVLDDGCVFCSEKCRDKHKAYWGAKKAVDAAVREDFQAQ